jgi:pimeloyl-ACP methyl ester carboxylesterase
VADSSQVSLPTGITLRVLTWPGDGVPMLLVHGLASNARLWDGVGDALAGLGHAVAAVDLRGHGRSDKPDSGYGFAAVTDDVAALIEAMGFDQPVVAGQSWGGNVAMELAARHPDLARGIACVDGGTIDLARRFPEWDDCAKALAPPRLIGRPLADIEAMMRANHPDWPETGIQGALACFEVRTDGTVAPWLTFERHMQILRAMWEQHLPDVFPRVATPVLLIPADSGQVAWTADKRVATAAAEAALARARTSWIVGDHDLHAQHPARIAQLLHDAVADGFFA